MVDRRPARRLVAGLAAIVVVLGACASDGGDGGAPAAVDGQPDRGLGTCDQDPDGCNSGARAEGGEIEWLLEQGWNGQWNTMRVEGASVYLAGALAGTTPEIGDFAPSGTWTWNLDLLAAEPEITATAPQTMVYRLREEAVWNDGVPISVDDFRYSWFHLSGREDHCAGCNPADTTGWSQVADVEGSDGGQTVTITMRDGVVDPEWFVRFAPSHLPAHVAEAAGHDWRTPEGMGASSEYFRDTVPTWSGGPYVIQSAVADERVVMVANPRWYGATRPTLDRIVKEVITSQPDWPVALANGEIDGGSPLSVTPDVVERIRATPGTRTGVGSAGATWEHVQVNLANPWLGDLSLRRAVFTALDTADARQRVYGELGPPVRTNPIFAATSPYHVDVLRPRGYGSGDTEAARRILADAGYTGASPGQALTTEGEAVPALRFVYLAGNENRETYVELAQSYLADIGLTVEPVAVPGSAFGTTLGQRDFDLVVLGFSGGPVFTRAPGRYFHSESGVNLSGLADEEIDRLSQEVLGEIDLDRAAARANDAVDLVMERAAILPLWENLAFVFVSDDYVNIRDNPNSSFRALYNTEAWGVAE